MVARTTTALRFELQDEPGQLQEVTQRLAKEDVNIDGIGALATGGAGLVEIVPDDAATARSAIEGAGVDVEPVDAIVVDVPDEPGQLDQRLQDLAREGINVEALFPVSGSPSRLAFTVDDTERAQQIVGE